MDTVLAWVERYLLELIIGVVVPILVVWYRYRRSFRGVASSLSKDEAVFRADLLVRLNTMQEKYDSLHEAYLQCEAKHSEANMKLARLEDKLMWLRGEWPNARD